MREQDKLQYAELFNNQSYWLTSKLIVLNFELA